MQKDLRAFRCVEESGKFEVIGPSGRSILTCRDESSGKHYAVLLSQAYRQGYDEGYHAAKSGEG